MDFAVTEKGEPMRLIDADKLLKNWCESICKPKPNCSDDCFVYSEITNAPTVYVRENVRARWTYDENNNFVCSNCGNSVSFTAIDGGWTLGRFCQTCGADMRGDNNEIN